MHRYAISMAWLLCVVGIAAAEEQPSWTVLFYGEPSKSLTDAIIKNINDCALGLTQEARVAIYAQLSICIDTAPPRSELWCYRIKPKTLQIEKSIIPVGLSRVDIVRAIEWAFSEHPATHYALIIGGHGYGMLSPRWDVVRKAWHVEADGSSVDSSLASKKQYRGVLLNDPHQNYLTTRDLALVAQRAATVTGKSLALFALDCCLGACIEHLYELAPWVDIFIGCQNCEPPDGFDYCAFAQRLGSVTPTELAVGIVHDYAAYYTKRNAQQMYTLSAIDCRLVTPLVQLLDQIATILLACLQGLSTGPAIKLLRKELPSFCFLPMSTDLMMVLTKFEQHAALVGELYQDEFLALVQEAKRVLTEAVIANAVGRTLDSHAFGLSIYFPFCHVDSSYDKNAFAATKWGQFLQALLG